MAVHVTLQFDKPKVIEVGVKIFKMLKSLCKCEHFRIDYSGRLFLLAATTYL